MKLEFKNTEKWRTFFYGVCSDAQITELVSQAEEEGGMLIAVIPGHIQPPQAAIALPGASSKPIPVLKVLVRMRESDYAVLVKKSEASLALARQAALGKDVH